MVEELKNSLIEQYQSASIAIGSKWMAREMTKEDGEENEYDTYDIALLKIFFTDYAEENAVEQKVPVAQVRIRKEEDKEEEILVILGTIGMGKTMEDELDFEFCATRLEEFTQRFLESFPDILYRYEWYNDIK